MAVVATFQSMGLRAEKSVASYLLLESNFAFESNLDSDIANVKYLHRHPGQTHLQPIESFPVFVNDCLACCGSYSGPFCKAFAMAWLAVLRF